MENEFYYQMLWQRQQIHDIAVGKRFGTFYPNILIPEYHNLDDMMTWCDKNIGRYRWEVVLDRFCFLTEEDRMWFQMFWVNSQNNKKLF